MSGLNLSITGYGRAILAGSYSTSGGPTVISPVSQVQNDLITISVGSGKIGVVFRVGAYSKKAALQYNVLKLQGSWDAVYVDYTTNPATTAALLKIAIDALNLPITVTDNLDGTLNVEADESYYEVQYRGFVGCSRTMIRRGFDINSYAGDMYMVAQVLDGSIEYSEPQPDLTDGFLVTDKGTFNLFSKKSILETRVATVSGTPVIKYEIFI